jgi:glycosyltransferase involved in cell wall biosynthesis
MKISIVIPAYNEERCIGECLESILKQYPSPDEIVVVDNASTDQTSIKASIKGVRVVRELEKGTSAARQRGFKETSGDLIVFVDADCQLPEGWIQHVTEQFTLHPELQCATGPYHWHFSSGTRRLFSWITWSIIIPLQAALFGNFLNGGNFAVRRQALIAIGGFDTTIRFYGDDIDTGRKLAKSGRRVLYDKKMAVITSTRRFDSEGFWKTASHYSSALISRYVFGRTTGMDSKAVR